MKVSHVKKPANRAQCPKQPLNLLSLITVYDYRGNSSKNPRKMTVEAVCVQGKTGFKAWFPDPKNVKSIIQAAGDDGHWWIENEFDSHWLPEIASKIQLVNILFGPKFS